MKKQLIAGMLGWLASTQVNALALSDLAGTWQRFSDNGELLEQISTKSAPDPNLIFSEVTYYAANKRTHGGYSMLIEKDEAISGVIQISNGTRIDLSQVKKTEGSIAFKLTFIDVNTAQAVNTLYTDFSISNIDTGRQMIQRVFGDAEMKNVMQTGIFLDI